MRHAALVLAFLALPLAVQTAVSPFVARVQPANGATRIALDASISTQFSAKMDRGTMTRALTVKVDLVTGGPPDEVEIPSTIQGILQVGIEQAAREEYNQPTPFGLWREV